MSGTGTATVLPVIPQDLDFLTATNLDSYSRNRKISPVVVKLTDGIHLFQPPDDTPFVNRYVSSMLGTV